MELVNDKAIYHYHHLTDQRNRNGRPTVTYPSEPEELPPSTPRRTTASARPSTTRPTRHRLTSITISDSDDETMPPSRQTRNHRGQLTGKLPEALTRMDGLRAPNENDFPGTCVGVAELFSIFAELLDRLHKTDNDEEYSAI